MSDDRAQRSMWVSRRTILVGASLPVVVPAVGLVTGPERKLDTAPESSSSGYLETDHIKTYYRLSRF